MGRRKGRVEGWCGERKGGRKVWEEGKGRECGKVNRMTSGKVTRESLMPLQECSEGGISDGGIPEGGG